MFKKVKRQKLSLNRETVRTLHSAELDRAAGGVFKNTAWGMCSYTNQDAQTDGDQDTPCPTCTANPCQSVFLCAW